MSKNESRFKRGHTVNTPVLKILFFVMSERDISDTFFLSLKIQ